MTMLIKNARKEAGQSRRGGETLRVYECHNLCPSEEAGGDESDRRRGADVLRAVGVPRQILAGGWKPLCAASSAPLREIAVCRGNEIGVYDVASAELSVIGSTARAPMCATFDDGGDRLTVMAQDGVYLARRREETEERGESDATTASDETPWEMLRMDSTVWPAISVLAEAAGEVSVTLPSRELSREYTSGIPLASVDERVIAADIRRACDEVSDSAAAAGALCAPCIARCRITDADGNTLYMTPPVLLNVDAEDPFAETIAYDSADRKTLAEKTLKVALYRPRIVVGAGAAPLLQHLAVRMTLEKTPQFLPIRSGSVSVRASFGRTPGAGYMRVSVCNLEGLSASRPAGSRRRVLDSLSRFDRQAHTAAVIAHPLSRGAWSRTVEIGEGIEQQTYAPRLSALSGGFIASMSAQASGATLWGGVQPVRFGGYSLADYAAALQDIAWSGRVRVTFADGHRDVVWRGGGSTGAPVRLTPLLSYPHPAATSIEIDLEIAGTHYHHKTDIEAIASGEYSCAVDSGMRAVTPSPSADSGDDDTPSGDAVEPLAEGLLVATQPGSIVARCRTTLPGAVRAVIAANAAGGAWDYGRTRFYGVSGDGIRVVTVGEGFSGISTSLVSAATVATPRCVCRGDDAVYALCQGYIAALRGNRVEVLTTDIPLRGKAILWMPRRRALAVFADEADTQVYCADYGYDRYTTDPLAVSEVLGNGDCALVSTASGILLDIDRLDAPVVSTSVRWTACADSGNVAGRTLRSLTWDIDAQEVDGDMSAGRMYMSPRRLLLSRVSYTGAMRTPLTVAAPARRVTSLWLSIDAGISADGRISAPRYQML